ncbi:hypothetical protein F0327_25285 [Citrobacter braakii]|nr:hypothetical protein F0327_25285 [Citrobacter braakii]
MDKIELTASQIKSLAKFAEEEGQQKYTICWGHIPADDGIDEYSGLIAFSGSEEHGVLQLE